MDNSEFLGHFWRLGSGDGSIRRAATSSLLDALQAASVKTSDESMAVVNHLKNDVADQKMEKWMYKDFQYKLPTHHDLPSSFVETLEYTTNRLIHGLSSNREAIRLGYATALTMILKKFPKAVPMTTIVDAIHSTTKLTQKNNLTPTEQRDLLLGRIFGYSAVQQAEFFKSTLCLSHVELVMNDLFEVLDKKSYLQDCSALAITSIVKNIEIHNPGIAMKFVSPRLTKIFDPNTLRCLQESPPPPGEDSKQKRLGVDAPFGLLGIYLTLHKYLIELPVYKQRTHNTLDKNYSKWSSVQKDPLINDESLDACLCILSHQTAILSCHPKIPLAWNTLFSLLIHQCNNSDKKLRLFDKILRTLCQSFFTVQKSSSDQHVTLQKIFYGFRIMIEILMILKVDSLRPNSAPELPQLISSFWTSCDGFPRQLLFHCRTSPPTPLRQAAQDCLNVLTQIVHGVPFKRLEQPVVHKKKEAKEISLPLDVVTAGVYSLADLSLTSEEQQGIAAAHLPQPLLAPLYTQPMRIDLSVWLEGIEVFGKSSNYSQLDSLTLPRLINLFFGNSSFKARSDYFDKIFHLFMTESFNNHSRWIWYSEFLAELIFTAPYDHFNWPAAYSLVLQFLTHVTMKVIPAAAAAANDASGVLQEPSMIIAKSHGDRIPILTGAIPEFIKRRLLSRIGPSISHLIRKVCQPAIAIIAELNGTLKDNFDTRASMACHSIKQFSNEFLMPVMTGFIHFTDNHKFPSCDSCLRYFKENASETQQAAPMLLNVDNGSGQIVKVHMINDSHLTYNEIKSCLFYGSALVHISNHLSNLLHQTITNDEKRRRHLHVIRLLLESEVLILSFSSLVFAAFMMACRQIDEQPQTENSWIAETDCKALLDLMKQISNISPGFFLAAPETLTTSLSECLQVMVDVIPSVCSPSNNDENAVAYQSDSRRRLGHSLLSGILLHVFPSVCRFVSNDTILELVDEGIAESQEKNSKEDQSDIDEHHEEKEEMEEESDEDIESDSGRKDNSTLKRESDQDSGESDQENESESEETITTVKDEQLLSFLLDSDALKPQDSESDDIEDDNVEPPISNPFTKDKKKVKTNKNHVRRIKVQSRFRALDLLSSILDSKFNYLIHLMSTSTYEVPVAQLLQSLYDAIAWNVKLDIGLRNQISRLARGLQKQQKSGIKKQEMLQLYTELSGKLESLLSSQTTKLINLLNKPIVLPPLESSEIIWTLLRQLNSLCDTFCKSYQKSSQKFIKLDQMSKYFEISASLTLSLGKFEEHLLMQLQSIETKDLKQKKYNKFVTQHYKINNNSVVEISSSTTTTTTTTGLIFSDLLISLTINWISKKHPQICEKFFRSLTTLTTRHLSHDPPIGLVVAPFGIASIMTSKLFICRELLAVDADLKQLGQAALISSDDSKFMCSPLGILFAKSLLQWSISWIASIPICSEFTSKCLPPIESFVKRQKLTSVDTFLCQILIGIACGKEVMNAIKRTRQSDVVMKCAIDDVDGVQSKAPIACQSLKNVQKSAKILFEQHTVATLKRYGKIVAYYSSDGKDKITLDSMIPYLESALEDTKQLATIRPSHRRKRQRRDIK